MRAPLSATIFLLAASFCAMASDGKLSEWDQPCHPISAMPKTKILVTPAEATAYWLRIAPSRFAGMPAITNDMESGGIYPDSIRDQDVPQGMKKADYARALSDLHEFKRTHAHEFWKEYEGQRITVEGYHYCPCCFHAAIRTPDCRGWTNFVIRLGYYVAIGLPPGTRCYTEDGSPVPRKSIQTWPPPPSVKAVGTVSAPRAMPKYDGTEIPTRPTACAYYVLEQQK